MRTVNEIAGMIITTAQPADEWLLGYGVRLAEQAGEFPRRGP